jgi:hypothetical protein
MSLSWILASSNNNRSSSDSSNSATKRILSLLTRCVKYNGGIIPCSAMALSMSVSNSFQNRFITSTYVRNILRVLEECSNNIKNNSRNSCSSSMLVQAALSHLIKNTNNHGLLFEKSELSSLQRKWYKTLVNGGSSGGRGDNNRSSDASMALLEYYVDVYNDSGSSSSSSCYLSIFSRPCLFRVYEVSKETGMSASTLKEYVKVVETTLQGTSFYLPLLFTFSFCPFLVLSALN